LALSYFWSFTILLGVLLDIVVIAAMQRRKHYARYPLVFAYLVILLLTTTVESALLYGMPALAKNRKTYALYYWSNEVILQALIFIVMLSLIRRASEGFPKRWVWSVTPAGVVVGIVSYSVYSVGTQSGITQHMTVVSRDLSFCTALLNLVLWSALLRNRKRSVELLLVSGGIGLQTTAKALGHSLRSLSLATKTPGNFIVVLGHLLCLFIWWRTFRRSAPRPANVVSEAA
jgi:hypothetical protein